MMLVLLDLTMEQSNVRKKITEPPNVTKAGSYNGTTECDKSRVICDVGIVQCDYGIVKCE